MMSLNVRRKVNYWVPYARPFWALVTPACCEPPKDVFPCYTLWTLIYIQGLFGDHLYICILACSGCQIEKYQRDPPVCFNKEKGCIVYVQAWIGIGIKRGISVRCQSNIPVYWNQMIRRCDLGSFKGAMYIATLGCWAKHVVDPLLYTRWFLTKWIYTLN